MLEGHQQKARASEALLFQQLNDGIVKETMETYKQYVKEARLSYGKPPKIVPDVRIRRKLMEGSYPNWTVRKENDLPKLLRYVLGPRVSSKNPVSPSLFIWSVSK